MSDDLEQLEQWAGELLARLEPAERRRLTRKIATDLRRSQAARIASQRNPDGSAYAPRKPREPLRARKGRIKRQARKRTMFAKLRQARYLKASSTEAEAAVGFANATVARIAAIHHYGLRDRVARRRGSPEVTYPARQLLGLTEAEELRILELLTAQLEG